MAGEISPDIMFWQIRSKVPRMGLDGFRWVRMGENLCISKEGGKNKAKRTVNRRSGHVFGCLYREGKCSKSTGIVMVD